MLRIKQEMRPFCTAMLEAAGLNGESSSHRGKPFAEVAPVFTTSLGALAETIQSFRDLRRTLRTPALDDPFIVRLYATYLSYLEPTDFAYQLDIKADQRGSLAEFIKSPSFGQIFVSHTRPGVTRGGHYHHTRAEKFLVLQGDAVIRFRHMRDDSVVEYPVSGRECKVLDIPPGYTHSIENVGDTDLVTLFRADELFDPKRPDTFFERVIPNNDNHS